MNQALSSCNRNIVFKNFEIPEFLQSCIAKAIELGVSFVGELWHDMGVLKSNSTKIIATIGPASQSPKVIKELVRAGVRGFRLNFSHGSHADHAISISYVRQVEQLLQTPCSVIADLQGPKIRIGKLSNPIRVKRGDKLIFTPKGVGGSIPLPHRDIFPLIGRNKIVLMDDGKIECKVSEVDVDAEKFVCKVQTGGELVSHKSFTIPQLVLPIGSLTSKDRQDLEFALGQDIDWVALSFVQRPEDIRELRGLIEHFCAGKDHRPSIIAKLERLIAVQKNLLPIIRETDAVMVARGDLGTETSAYDVPIYQKRIVNLCNREGKPVIVATQMMESMLSSAIPSRAETTDVANAVLDGADCVMLSAETATSKRPVKIARTMSNIIKRIERSDYFEKNRDPHLTILDPRNVPDAISYAVAVISRFFDVKLIVAFTTTGTTARRISHFRPSIPLISISPSWSTARKSALLWGCTPFKVKVEVSGEGREIQELALRIVRDYKLLPPNKKFLMASGYPMGEPGSTSSMFLLKS